MIRNKRKTKRIYHPDGDRLAEATVRAFYSCLTDMLSSYENVVISLSGGRSVQPFYRLIPEFSEFVSRDNWKRVHFFWTDERLVPADSPESNYKLAKDFFLSELKKKGILSSSNIHGFPGDTAEPGKAINNYQFELKRVSGGVVHLPVLGAGGDGHVGSLFPDSSTLEVDEDDFVYIDNSPKPPKRRISISPGAIKRSVYPFLFFLGEEKKEAYDCFKNRSKAYSDCPCKLALTGTSGTCYVITNLELSE
ncbi:6-phosphogluconolactonase [Candidatus Bipolaricaulota bacterium]|nr:6-phosphogluconolactonase [Candidatus Bipolaricaulota bacterium]